MDVSAFWYHHPAFDHMGFVLENHQFLSKYIGPGFSLQRGAKLEPRRSLNFCYIMFKWYEYKQYVDDMIQ